MEKRNSIDNLPFKGREKLYYSANNMYPEARRNELNALLNLVSFKEKYSFLDLQSATGYVAEGINKKWKKHGKIICVEPSKKLSTLISDKFIVINSELESINISDESVDIVICLAGLHHSYSLDAVIRECHRILKPNGQCILSDVEINSTMDLWLNEFVHKWSITGHKGNFIKLGDFSKSFKLMEMKPIYEKKLDVPWKFENSYHMEQFIYEIFGLNIPEKKVFKEGLKKYLKYNNNNNIELEWQLIYSKAIKKA